MNICIECFVKLLNRDFVDRASSIQLLISACCRTGTGHLPPSIHPLDTDKVMSLLPLIGLSHIRIPPRRTSYLRPFCAPRERPATDDAGLGGEVTFSFAFGDFCVPFPAASTTVKSSAFATGLNAQENA